MMQKPAAIFIFAAVFLATLWFADLDPAPEDRGDIPAFDTSAASETDSGREDSFVDIEPAATPADTTPSRQLSISETSRLFSGPDNYGSVEYLDALDNAHRYVAGFPVPVSSAQLVKRNDAAIEELVRQLDSKPDRLSSPFEVSPPEVRQCTISTITRVSPDFEPGASAPTQYRVHSSCDETGDVVTVGVDKSSKARLGFGISSSRLAGISITTIDDSAYAVALQFYPANR